MTIGKRISELRTEKGWAQNELAKRVGVSREMMGRYERDDAVPSIDIAKRMAEALGVSLDFLVGNVEEELDRGTVQRILEVNKMSSEDKSLVYAFLDAFITKTKLQGIVNL